ncbi:restriction endonuclease subunit S [Enterobacter sp. CGMCC 5087]|uniref:restriction endonuclease subunit S n=1 Tax=Enterobacter sp. CGMCC 5087 TaxID=2183878 RepID=UPI0015E8209F|nr:restriction endonuclease subunit S [Enterobacter sp. CGMCC 5087]
MAKYKAYPEYKDSGMEWLNSTPAHWSKAPIKYLALAASSVFLDGDWIESKDLSDDGVRYITTGNIGEGFYKEQSSGFITEKTFNKLDCTEILEGDILISRLNKPIGRACLVSELNFKTVTSVDNVIFRTDESYNKKYLVYLFSSNYYFQHTGNLARGTTMQRISRGLLGNIRIPVPLLSEQVIITAFLDHETTKIDNLMEKQQQLIELLKEKRQAVISHAVTKGLNPDAPMKDSGVDWLGNIPEHWMLKRAKFIFRKMQRPISKHAGIITAFRDGHVTLRQNKRTDGFTFAIKEIGYQGVLKGDLVIHAMDGFAGAIGVSDSNGKCSPVCSVCIPHKKTQVYTSYYGYLVRQLAVTNFIQSLSKGIRERSTEFRFNEFSELPLPIPNYEEQIFIFKYIKRQEEKIDVLLQKQLQQIDLLKERRTALIAAAVTGKIDLRDWTPPASSTEASLAAEEATA